jgi:hypothetical protein
MRWIFGSKPFTFIFASLFTERADKVLVKSRLKSPGTRESRGA